MKRPRVSRPHMPGYGLQPAGEGTGLLPFRVRPVWAFGLQAGDFTGSPTRWDFGPG
jgi:hypothetical protein